MKVVYCASVQVKQRIFWHSLTFSGLKWPFEALQLLPRFPSMWTWNPWFPETIKLSYLVGAYNAWFKMVFFCYYFLGSTCHFDLIWLDAQVSISAIYTLWHTSKSKFENCEVILWSLWYFHGSFHVSRSIPLECTQSISLPDWI